MHGDIAAGRPDVRTDSAPVRGREHQDGTGEEPSQDQSGQVSSAPIRVVVADDHPFIRAGVAALLSTADGIEVVGQCADGAEAVEVSAAARPDVVLLDVDMPVLSGFDATRQLLQAQPDLRVVMLSVSILTHGGPEGAERAGAVGYLIKGDPRRVIEAVRTVAAGGTVWPAGYPAAD
jgi:DNA-binding NarL/FixJ family response regulator